MLAALGVLTFSFSLPMTKIAVRRALISVYDKTGLEELASGLHAAGVEIVSTGSTVKSSEVRTQVTSSRP